MFRLWGKIIKSNHLIKDAVIERDDDTRTRRIFGAIDELCMQWDLGRPIWLDSNSSDFKKHSKTRFYKDSFIETIDFDYMEIQVIEE